MKLVIVNVDLDASVCNSKQRWKNDKCRCKYKELIDQGICDKEFIWNPSNCECECDKSCDAGEYLDDVNCKCRKKLVDKLIEKCTENIEEAKITDIRLFECNSVEHKNECKSSSTIYVVLIAKGFRICVGICTYFVYYNYMSHNKKTALKYDYGYQASNY